MIPVGYLTNQMDGLHGSRGEYYDYLLGKNGLFIEARSPLLSVRVPVAAAEVRGLNPVEPKVDLQHGLIPNHLWQLALNLMLSNAHQETYLAVTWEGEYRLRLPDQEQGNIAVKYSTIPSTVLDLHSHSEMRAFFSGADDRDEQGLQLYGVVGKLTGHTEVLFRVGAYGYFSMLSWYQVFQGELSGAVEASAEPSSGEGQEPELLRLWPGAIICREEGGEI